ncbi:adenylyl-sulfate kinase [uncultured Chitinophaga sp.]|jgi:adenylylsulfate kinase (apsK)|uniref:adenylyl-sulfate kinase n=1 Tax=uncultured Chitinophaga sp. TaxID=339340 RepID=UPI00261CD65E|nr:adenylyl-sulfate kinase [uncultured Chitinophaga sp.]
MQAATVLWLLGIPCSGKTTLAYKIKSELDKQRIPCKVLDGDELRSGINADLGFSPQDREENIRRAAEIAKLFLDAGFVTICSFITPTAKLRHLARGIIGSEHFHEIYVSCSISVCMQRDVKGMYNKARNGIIKNFTGLQSAFEAPEAPFLTVNTEENDVAASASEILAAVFPSLFGQMGREALPSTL